MKKEITDRNNTRSSMVAAVGYGRLCYFKPLVGNVDSYHIVVYCIFFAKTRGNGSGNK